MRKLFLILVMVMGLSGCVTVEELRQQQQAERQAKFQAEQAVKDAEKAKLIDKIQAANISQLPKNWKLMIEAWVKSMLKDPESAKFVYESQPPGIIAGVSKWGRKNADGSYTFGWQVLFAVNAKNSLGGYGGYKPYIAIFIDGRLEECFGGSS